LSNQQIRIDFLLLGFVDIWFLGFRENARIRVIISIYIVYINITQIIGEGFVEMTCIKDRVVL